MKKIILFLIFLFWFLWINNIGFADYTFSYQPNPSEVYRPRFAISSVTDFTTNINWLLYIKSIDCMNPNSWTWYNYLRFSVYLWSNLYNYFVIQNLWNYSFDINSFATWSYRFVTAQVGSWILSPTWGVSALQCVVHWFNFLDINSYTNFVSKYNSYFANYTNSWSSFSMSDFPILQSSWALVSVNSNWNETIGSVVADVRMYFIYCSILLTSVLVYLFFNKFLWRA